VSSFQIIVGSMLGGSEYVAEACEETLTGLGHQTQLHFQPKLDEIPTENQTWLICTSTHGAGEFPDNIQAFAADLKNKDLDLSSTRLLTVGIGDSSYDTFCQAAIKLENLSISKGCKPITEKCLLDMSQDIDPEALAQAWISENSDLL